MAEERTRYSDAELEEFKELILKKLENTKADYELLRSTITHTADNDTEDTSPTFKVLEEGATTLSKEESGRLAAHQMKFIRNLEMALVRIENKTYGICKTTGKLIPKERLMKVPHASDPHRPEPSSEGSGRSFRTYPDFRSGGAVRRGFVRHMLPLRSFWRRVFIRHLRMLRDTLLSGRSSSGTCACFEAHSSADPYCRESQGGVWLPRQSTFPNVKRMRSRRLETVGA